MAIEFGILNSEFGMVPRPDSEHRGGGWEFRIQNSEFRISRTRRPS
jgi:hypothetical protein